MAWAVREPPPRIARAARWEARESVPRLGMRPAVPGSRAPAQKRALVGFGIIGGRLIVDHALDPRRILRILRRRQGHDRKAVRLHLRVDRWVVPTFDGGSSGDILQASPAPVDDDRELCAAPQRRIERRDERPKRVVRDDAHLVCGRRGRRHFAVTRLDWTRSSSSPVSNSPQYSCSGLRGWLRWPPASAESKASPPRASAAGGRLERSLADVLEHELRQAKQRPPEPRPEGLAAVHRHHREPDRARGEASH